MDEHGPGPPPKAIWAYAYDIVPPQADDGLRAIQALLDVEHAAALDGGRTWVGRVVTGQHITHILVVSDSPDQSRAINVDLESALTELKAGFALTVPMAVPDDRPVPAAAEQPSEIESGRLRRAFGNNGRRSPLE